MGWLLLIFFLYYLCLLTERALVGLMPHDLELLRSDTGQAGKRALSLSMQIRASLASLLLGRMLLISFSGILSAAILVDAQPVQQLLESWAQQNGFPPMLVWTAEFLIASTGLALIFWALHNLYIPAQKEGWAMNVLRKLSWWGVFWKTIFKPLTQKETVPQHPAEEPQSSLSSPGSSEKRELELLKSIVQFGDVTVKQVMQPRSRVVSVDFKTRFDELLEVVRSSEFSRLPVCDEGMDNVTGILYVKDLLPYLDETPDFEWQKLIRTNVLVVPEAKRGSELLEEFKQQRMHMAIVVDEYGGVAGIATMEDILEEVTGDIRDEFDEESDIRYRKIDEYNYVFEGQTLLNDVCRIAGITPALFEDLRGNADTLAGLVLELRGDIPVTGTIVSANGITLSVTAANRRKVEQVKLSLPRAANA